MNAISIRGLTKNFGGFQLNIPALDIPKGYITGFIGRNGAGKTTTIKLIMDMIRPDSGQITILGGTIAENGRELKQEIGLVGEMSGYIGQCKVGQIHDMIAPFYRNWDEELYRSYMERFHIPGDQKLAKLSKGQGKIFDLIMTLSHRPKLLILDEPTANLDPVVRAEILDILKELMVDEEMTILYSTHITSDLEHAGDYLVLIDSGELVFTAEKDTLLENSCIVKGDNRLITPETQGLFAGLVQNSVGFRGLCENAQLAKDTFGSEAVYDPASIEDIMVYTARRDC